MIANAELRTAERLLAYPNPTGGQVTLEAEAAIEWIAVRNALGQALRVRRYVDRGLSKTVDLSGLPAGLYHLEVSVGGWPVRVPVSKH
ncbi:MAG: T9SS type A sorting domain-containing protein [Catalinimonas sp.]